MSPEFVFKDTDRESRLLRRRLLFLGSIILVLFVLLVSRIGYLQIVKHEHYTTLSQDNRVKILPVPPTRGLIYSSDGVLLADNQPSYSLEIIPEQVDDLEQLINELSSIIEIEESDIERFYKSLKRIRRFEQVPLRFNLDDREVARFAVRRHHYPGADVTARLKRKYPLAESVAHTVGYVGRIDERDQQRIDIANYRGSSHIGKTGIEKSYEDILHGKVGYEQVEVNAQGRIIRVLDKKSAVPGRNIRLTLDMSLQKEAIDALDGRRGAVVAMDPRNGEVLALVSNPSFDANLFVDGIRASVYRALQKSWEKPLFNRAMMGQYPPGSTLKPFFGLAALEYDVRKPQDRTWCPGWFSLEGSSHRYRDWKRTGHGHMDLQDAIIQSCDVYFYELAHELGIDRMHDFLVKFGFGRKSGIEIGPESSGNVPSPEWKRGMYGEPWYRGETIITGIGQGFLLTTPLQLASATAILANHGTMITPHLLKETVDPLDSTVINTYDAKSKQLQIGKERDWQEIEKAMIDVMHGDRGTARRTGQGAGYKIAGKTGTAQVVAIPQGEEYKEDELAEIHRDHGLFVAYAPVDSPRLAVAVIVENAGSGSTSAAPVARKLFDHVLNQGNN